MKVLFIIPGDEEGKTLQNESDEKPKRYSYDCAVHLDEGNVLPANNNDGGESDENLSSTDSENELGELKSHYRKETFV